MNIALKQVALPPQAEPTTPPILPTQDYEARIASLYGDAQTDWVVVYGDREHTANLAFLCGFDPRFEEAVLLLGPNAKRVLVLGNEGVGYTCAVTVPVEIALSQSLGLMGQPRDTAPRLSDVLATSGMQNGNSVGVVGWKYLEADECDDPTAPAFVPAFLIHALRKVVGKSARVVDVTHVLMHPTQGLKSHNSAAQIAAYAFAAERASHAIMRIVRGARPGMSEQSAFALSRYEGDALACHSMLSVGNRDALVGLRSPSARELSYGDGITTAIGLRGSLSCRAGMLAATPDASFVENYVAPYMSAVFTWWQTVRVGVSGGNIFGNVMSALGGAPFKPALNPGHLIAIDEWTHTPIYANSTQTLSSGMALQCDIIPTPMPNGTALNCEDTVAIADASLRAQIAAQYPELWARIQMRRAFMRDALGVALSEDALPLSINCAYFMPYWLAHDLVCVAA